MRLDLNYETLRYSDLCISKNIVLMESRAIVFDRSIFDCNIVTVSNLHSGIRFHKWPNSSTIAIAIALAILLVAWTNIVDRKLQLNVEMGDHRLCRRTRLTKIWDVNIRSRGTKKSEYGLDRLLWFENIDSRNKVQWISILITCMRLRSVFSDFSWKIMWRTHYWNICMQQTFVYIANRSIIVLMHGTLSNVSFERTTQTYSCNQDLSILIYIYFLQNI